MGRKPLPERVLLKLSAGTLASIDDRLRGKTRAEFIRAAIEEKVAKTLPSSAGASKPRAEPQKVEEPKFAPASRRPPKSAPQVELTPEEKAARHVAKMREVTGLLPETAQSALDKPAIRRAPRSKDETGPLTGDKF
jgi:hypothetical protein